MSKDNEDNSLLRKISDLRSNRDFENPKISQEGYGTLFPSECRIDSLFQEADSLKAAANSVKSKESVVLLMKSLYLYLKVNSLIKESDVKQYLNMMKIVIKHLEFTMLQAQEYNATEYFQPLEWASFNLKTIKLFKEAELLGKAQDFNFYSYVIDMLKAMNRYYLKNISHSIEIVKLEEIERGIKQRLLSISIKEHI